MKYKYLMLLLFLAVTQIGFSQNCDPAHSGVEVRNSSNTAAASSVAVGQDVLFKFRLFNDGSASSCDVPVGNFNVTLSFPTITGGVKPYSFNAQPLGTTFQTALFTWTYDASENVLVGVNRLPVPILGTGVVSEDLVLIPVRGLAIGVANTPFNISVTGGTTNNSANDGSIIPLTVGAAGGPLPITLNEFDAKAENCISVLNWKTSNETNLSKYEIESSTDGIVFTAVGTVKPNASNTTGLYQFSWNQKAGKAYYRLKIIDNDASVSYSKIIPVTSDCLDKKVVKLYPNPVNTAQILNVNISGYDKGIRGDLYSATGQFIKSYVLKNGKNDLTVENLSQGFYTLKISENGTQTEVFKLNVVR
jgi:Secretion system C-terminal sorting domain